METDSRFWTRWRTATPLFIGGAKRWDKNRIEHPAELLRPTSVKGALRFWWRALAYSSIRAASADTVSALQELQARERRIFGAAAGAGQQPFGQARVRLHVRPVGSIKRYSKGQLPGAKAPGPGARYLGYGLMQAFGKNAGLLQRGAIQEGQEFELLVTMCGLQPDERRSVKDALWLMGMLGGLGARARRGWGSLALMALKDGDMVETLPVRVEDFTKKLADLLKPAAALMDLPPLTSFSAHSRIEIVGRGNDPMALLDQVGRAMQRYRSWGHRGEVNHQPSEKNFKDDHDWFKKAEGVRLEARVPDRVAFGLPQNYSKDITVKPENTGRRASPLFIHIQPTQRDGYLAILAHIPAVFLPKGEKIALASKQEKKLVKPLSDAAMQATIDGFFDGGQPGGRYFSNRTVIFGRVA